MIKEQLNAVLVEELTYSSTSIEHLFVQWTVAAAMILVWICYRPPNTKFEQFVLNLPEMKNMIALRYSDHTIISMGDFILKLLNINTNSQTLQYYLNNSWFLFFGSKPTRVTSRIIFDNVLMNYISDHFPTYACFDLTV